MYRERLHRPLMIGPGVPVPAGVYDTDRASLWLRTGSSRRFRFNGTVSYGGLYDGTAWQTSLSLGGKASRFLHAFLDYNLLDASLAHGRFEIHNLGVRADVLFSPDLALMLVGQWDNLSEDFGMNFRLRWTPRPDRELVIVFSQNVSTLAGWQPLGSRLVSKAAWTFRF